MSEPLASLSPDAVIKGWLDQLPTPHPERAGGIRAREILRAHEVVEHITFVPVSLVALKEARQTYAGTGNPADLEVLLELVYQLVDQLVPGNSADIQTEWRCPRCGADAKAIRAITTGVRGTYANCSSCGWPVVQDGKPEDAKSKGTEQPG